MRAPQGRARSQTCRPRRAREATEGRGSRLLRDQAAEGPRRGARGELPQAQERNRRAEREATRRDQLAQSPAHHRATKEHGRHVKDAPVDRAASGGARGRPQGHSDPEQESGADAQRTHGQDPSDKEEPRRSGVRRHHGPEQQVRRKK